MCDSREFDKQSIKQALLPWLLTKIISWSVISTALDVGVLSGDNFSYQDLEQNNLNPGYEWWTTSTKDNSIVIPSYKDLAANTQSMRQALRYYRENGSHFGRIGHFSDAVTQKRLGYKFEDLDPLLVGRNVIFAPEWLEYVGDGQTALITRKNFAMWRDRMDIVYDGFAWLTNDLPKLGQRTIIRLEPDEYFRQFHQMTVSAHAHRNTSEICYSRDFVEVALNRIQKFQTWDFTLIHEIGHQFTFDVNNDGHNESWVPETESLSNLLVSFAMEHLGAKILTSELINNEKVIVDEDGNERRVTKWENLPEILSGDHLRRYILYMASNEINNPDIETRAFATRANNTYSVFDYKLHKPIDCFGWGPFRQTLQNWQHHGSSCMHNIASRLLAEKAYHIGGKENVDKLLSDELFRKHFLLSGGSYSSDGVTL